MSVTTGNLFKLMKFPILDLRLYRKFSLSRLVRTSENFNQQTTASSEEDNNYDKDIKTKILTASLLFVSQHGWSKEAIGAGAESLGYPEISRGLFPKGGISLVLHFQEECNKQINEEFNKINKIQQQTEKKDHEIIQSALEQRLRMLVPYLPHWPQAMALMATPSNAPSSLKLLLTLADDICFHAGDKSVDFTWYTRRAAVAGLYLSGELSLIQDSSPGHQDTWDFLSRRVTDLQQLQGCSSQFGVGGKQMGDVSSAAITTVRNILGLNSYSR